MDTLTGTSGNDIFTGVSGTGATSSAADTVNGGAGTDTLKIFTDATVVLPGTITSIEHLFINDSSAHENRDLTAAALVSAGVTELTLQNGTTIDNLTVTVTMGAGQSKLTLDGITDADAAAATTGDGGISWTTLATSATVAGTATLDLALNNVGAATTNTALTVDVATAAAKTLNVTSTGTNHVNLLNAGAGLTALNISGAGALTSYTALAAGITTVNAANATGNLNIDVSGVSARTVTGGKGNDTFVFGANYIGAEATVASGTRDVVNGGDGRDTISMTFARVDAADTTDQANLTSIETLLISDAVTGAIDTTKFTTIDTVTLTGATLTGAITVKAGNTVNLAADTGNGGITLAVSGTGTSDSLTLAMNGFDFDGATADVITGVETLNINTGATVTNAAIFSNALTLTPSAGGTANIVATGANALTFTGVLSGAASLDASALTGILTVTGTPGNAMTIKGGSAADVINGSASNDAITGGNGADVITGAGGNDSIILTETTSAIDKVVFTGGGTTAAVVTANGTDTITGFGTNDTLQINALGDGSTTATGLTTVSSAAAQGALTDDTVLILNVAGTAGALTTGGTATVTDWTNLTQVSAFLSERYTTTNDADQENVIVWNVGTTSYIYHVDTLAGGSTALAAAEIALVGVVEQTAALTSANLVYA